MKKIIILCLVIFFLQNSTVLHAMEVSKQQKFNAEKFLKAYRKKYRHQSRQPDNFKFLKAFIEENPEEEERIIEEVQRMAEEVKFLNDSNKKRLNQ